MTTVQPEATGESTGIDHHSPYFREHNYEIYENLRGKCPVAHSDAWGGFWMFLDHQDVYNAEQDTDLYSSAMEKGIPLAGNPDPLIPIDTDPPYLQQYRKIVLPWFSPAAAKRLESTFRRIATEQIDEFIETGEADIVRQLTTPLPARWILQMLGFDDSRWADWVAWVHATVHDRSNAPEKAMDAVMNVYTNITAEIALRRTEGYRDDLLSTIMQGEVDGAPIRDELVIGFAFLMLLGGMDTTSGLTGNALVRLVEQPELRQRLIDEPAILPKATEEFLRHDTPTQGLARIMTRDVVVQGQQLHAGDRILLMYAAANRDPKVFADPDTIDFDRTGNRHLAFGAGGHRCLGSNHARTMFQVMISEVLTRLPDYTIDGDFERFPDAGDVYAVRSLPIRFTPGPRSTC
uniref:cytochrome P450 n=1 Tax=Frankia gtarii TaxID=2950102 RepID=UPI0021C1FE2E